MPFLAVLLLAAATDAAATTFHDARAIALPRTVSQPSYVRLSLPQTIDGGPDGDYPSVRIADRENREVPYALDANPATSASQSVQLSDVGFVAGRYTQAIGDTGESGALHSNLELQTTQPTFFEHVEIATSDDRKTWTVVRPDALIYRVAANNDAGESTVDFGPSRARWIRVRVLDGAHAFPLSGASVAAESAPPRIVPLTAQTKISNSADETTVALAFGTPNTNVAAIAFETTTPEFSRNVSLSTGDSSTLSRYASGRPDLTIDLGNEHVRDVTATISNGNDPPLTGLRATALGYEHHVIFEAQPGEAYRLLWNGPDATPKYDLADRLSHEDWRPGMVATLATAPASTAFIATIPPAPKTPWLQEAALPIALVLACIVLGAIALFSLRKPHTDT